MIALEEIKRRYKFGPKLPLTPHPPYSGSNDGIVRDADGSFFASTMGNEHGAELIASAFMDIPVLISEIERLQATKEPKPLGFSDIYEY